MTTLATNNHRKLRISSRYNPMKKFWIIAVNCMFIGHVSAGYKVDLSLPENLLIGAGSAAYQIEGAWNVSDKGENIWDRWTHDNPNLIIDRSNGDIATNFYYKYKGDVQLVKHIGFNLFRFSIAWSRIFPNGSPHEISKDGLQFYKNLIIELEANGIQPIVTLYHWDHPQTIEDCGGWLNETIVDHFVSYAEVIFRELGDNVKIWTTINEPNIYCTGAYEGSPMLLAPGKSLIGTGKYICMHNMLKAHAKTYRLYDKKFRQKQQGEIGIVAHCHASKAAYHRDKKSSDIAFQFECGWIYNPIFNGDYPEIMKKRIDMISKAQGYQRSRLPKFSEKWISYIKGTYDYLGMNHYATQFVAPDRREALGIYNDDNGLIEKNNSRKFKHHQTLYRGDASGFGYVLRQVKDMYDNPPVRIMENGYPSDGQSNDYDRISYYHDYFKAMLIAIKRDKCNVKSYSIWSLLDDFEWSSGYTKQYGIINVDFNDPHRPRTGKVSASWWKSIFESRKLQPVPISIGNPHKHKQRKKHH